VIDRSQLIQLARLGGLRPHQQEKHYVQALVLNALAEEPLVFKGGTYLWFFHGLRRFSEYLDFTSADGTFRDLPSRVSSDLALMGVENRVKSETDDPRGLSFRISARGPLNTSSKDECHVYVEISRREKVLDRTLPLRFDFPQYALPVKTIRGMALDEVGAEKVRAILTREKARDLYDLHHLVTRKGIAYRADLVAEKLRYYELRFEEEAFLKRIQALEPSFSRQLKGLVLGALPNAGEVFETLAHWVRTGGMSPGAR
jgi:predicted nucleotidyltransferase component of viral defense system